MGLDLTINLPDDFADQLADEVQKRIEKGINEDRTTFYYTAKEVSEIVKTKPATIKRHIDQGLLKAYKPGKSWLITKKDLEDYVKSR